MLRNKEEFRIKIGHAIGKLGNGGVLKRELVKYLEMKKDLQLG